MEVSFLAPRPVKTDWLGNPRVDRYSESATNVILLGLSRVILGVVFLVNLPNNFHEPQSLRGPLFAAGVLGVLTAAIDWVPYRTHIWKRHPTTLTRWSTPAAGAIGLAFSFLALLLALQAEDSSVTTFGSCQFMALCLFLLNLCCALISNSGMLYFVHYEPLRLPSVYEPVCDHLVADSDSDSDSYDDAEIPDGKLAQLFLAQQVRVSHAVGVRHGESPVQPARNSGTVQVCSQNLCAYSEGGRKIEGH